LAAAAAAARFGAGRCCDDCYDELAAMNNAVRGGHLNICNNGEQQRRIAATAAAAPNASYCYSAVDCKALGLSLSIYVDSVY